MYDVAIIGGGVSGCSLLYALSRYRVKAVLLEKENDVGVATTKANSAIVHAGYDPEPGTLMARYNVEGNRLVEQLCRDLDILYRKTGSLVLGFCDAERPHVEKLYEQGIKNGVPGLRIIERDELHAMEPALSDEATFALWAPSAGVVNPWELASAQAEAAIEGGAEVRLDAEVTAIAQKPEGGYELQTKTGPLSARFVVNAAGIHADAVAAFLGAPGYTIHPSRGQYYLLDKTQGQVVQRVIFQCPTEQGKGVLVGPTVHGNLIVGPNAENGGDLTTTAEGLAYVRAEALRSVPCVNLRESIRNFAGLRAVADTGDFIVGEWPQHPGFFNIAGIKSPGLTAAPAIAQDMVRMLGEAGLPLEENPGFVKNRHVLRFSHLTKAQQAEAIAKNPLYAAIVCRCVTVTEGEIVDALLRPLPPRSLDAVKRRCGPGMGRCQGGFCGPRVQALIAKHFGTSQIDVPLDREGMQMLIGETKGGGAR